MRKIEELLEIMLENKSEFSYGLCGWVGELRCLKIISHEEEDFLKHYIQNNRPNIFSSLDTFINRKSPFFWCSMDIKPRIKWIEKHIKKQKSIYTIVI
jgi:hypothetical protein